MERPVNRDLSFLRKVLPKEIITEATMDRLISHMKHANSQGFAMLTTDHTGRGFEQNRMMLRGFNTRFLSGDHEDRPGRQYSFISVRGGWTEVRKVFAFRSVDNPDVYWTGRKEDGAGPVDKAHVEWTEEKLQQWQDRAQQALGGPVEIVPVVREYTGHESTMFLPDISKDEALELAKVLTAKPYEQQSVLWGEALGGEPTGAVYSIGGDGEMLKLGTGLSPDTIQQHWSRLRGREIQFVESSLWLDMAVSGFGGYCHWMCQLRQKHDELLKAQEIADSPVADE